MGEKISPGPRMKDKWGGRFSINVESIFLKKRVWRASDKKRWECQMKCLPLQSGEEKGLELLIEKIKKSFEGRKKAE